MHDTFTKEDVLDRRELDISGLEPEDIKYFHPQGYIPDNQFWDGGKCYTPVIYKAQEYKLRVNIRTAAHDDV